VWFGEFLPPPELTRARRAVEGCEALVVVGTSAEVYPAAELPAVAAAHGATVIEINPDPTPLTSRADLSWKATAGVALPALARALIPSGVAS
jgi:NAD-dependent deacetylase